MNIKQLTSSLKFENILKIKENEYVVQLDIKDFSCKFGIEVVYIKPIEDTTNPKLDIHINFRKQNTRYNPYAKTLEVIGSYFFIDGILKFKRFPQNPNAKVIMHIFTLEHESAVDYFKEKSLVALGVKFIPNEVAQNYVYQETYIAGATKDIPLTYEIDIFKHKTLHGSYCATEARTKLVKYSPHLFDEYSFRNWAKIFHQIFSEQPSEVEYLMRQQGLDMWGNKI
jgi:hypothetical protein